MMQCLSDIVGITNDECPCIISALNPEEIAALKVSKSGLYLDDLPGGVHLKELTNIDACKNLFVIAKRVRDNAIKAMESDLILALNTRYKKDKTNYTGNIGRLQFAQSLQVSRRYQYLRLSPNDYTDGVATISRIQLIFNASVNITLKLLRVIKDSVMGEEIGSWNLTTAANAYTTVGITGPLKLPMVYNGEIVEYYFYYDTTEPGVPFLPKDNGIRCSTCEKAHGYTQYLTAYGGQFEDLTALHAKTSDAYAHGIILDVQINCDNETLFCREYVNDDAIAVSMAHAVWFKFGELLIEEVQKMPDVSRYTTMAKEYLWGKRNHFRKEYQDRIPYLSSTIDVSAANCYVCRNQPNQPFIGPILV